MKTVWPRIAVPVAKIEHIKVFYALRKSRPGINKGFEVNHAGAGKKCRGTARRGNNSGNATVSGNLMAKEMITIARRRHRKLLEMMYKDGFSFGRDANVFF